MQVCKAFVVGKRHAVCLYNHKHQASGACKKTEQSGNMFAGKLQNNVLNKRFYLVFFVVQLEGIVFTGQ